MGLETHKVNKEPSQTKVVHVVEKNAIVFSLVFSFFLPTFHFGDDDLVVKA